MLLECHTNGSSNIAKPDTLKKEANFVVFIKNYRVYTSEIRYPREEDCFVSSVERRHSIDKGERPGCKKQF